MITRLCKPLICALFAFLLSSCYQSEKSEDLNSAPELSKSEIMRLLSMARFFKCQEITFALVGRDLFIYESPTIPTIIKIDDKYHLNMLADLTYHFKYKDNGYIFIVDQKEGILKSEGVPPIFCISGSINANGARKVLVPKE